MTIVNFPFGKETAQLTINKAEVLLPVVIPGVPDELDAIRKALATPIGSERLSQLAEGKSSVAIVINDITRPVPTESMLTAIIEELAVSGINTEQITVIVALGNHEMPTEEEIQKMVGYWYGRLKVICHDCYDKAALTYVGKTKRNMPVYVNKHYAEASLKILTGMITPHQSAGFSGGRKSVVPGIAGIETLQTHHSFPIRPEEAVMGIIEGNAFHEEAVSAAKLAGADFIVNVIKNFKNEVVDVVAGDLVEAHMHGVAICEKSWIRKVDHAFDVVFVSPGMFPKDIDLHQSQKALAVAEQVTKRGGTIVLVAECSHGIGKFGGILKRAENVDVVIEDFRKQGFSADHSSKAYMIARAIKKHRVIMVTTGINPAELAEMFMEGYTSIQEAAETALAGFDNPSVLCIPYAGECIPVLDATIP
ncbi:nickel-dependent lactate racemase [Anaerospora hongkongensis]|uniref:Nickel-dependent lactate racemase n=1 Tax=Anaerospora hongkongensis TaxID=244830 RepID=A0A4R1Q5K2_9FIRM|nr:nickel-dependent lactate racemase [Anaerospora hongkongensis]TCL39836.1 nickel-dependent lactate racemase [Anaerospora hongkongensis]